MELSKYILMFFLDPVILATAKLEQNSADFILNMRENCKISIKAISTMIEGVTHLTEEYVDVGLNMLEKSKNRDFNCLRQKVIYENEILKQIFRDHERIHKYLKYLFNRKNVCH